MPLTPTMRSTIVKFLRKPAYVKNLGTIIENANVNYADGRKGIDEAGADFSKMTARNTAYARVQLGEYHNFSRFGNWTVEEIVYNLPGIENPVLYSGKGPIFYNPETATKSHIKSNEFFINNPKLKISEDMKLYGKTWQEAISNLVKKEAKSIPLNRCTFELPTHEKFEIPVEELLAVDTAKVSDSVYFNNLSKEAQVAVVLWKDQTRDYAEKVLKPKGIAHVNCYVVPKENAKNEKAAFSLALWSKGIDNDNSDIDCNGGLNFHLGVRGILETRKNAEEKAQKIDYDPLIKEFGINSNEELRKALEIYKHATELAK